MYCQPGVPGVFVAIVDKRIQALASCSGLIWLQLLVQSSL